jgi:tetratricopeptide (TPR) repeat protein
MINHITGRWFSVLVALAVLAVAPRTILGQVPGAETTFRLAQGLEQSGEYEEAAKLYRELYLRDQANIVYFDALQRALTHLKRYDEVIGLMNDRLSRNPGDVTLRAQLGSIYYRAGMGQKAQEEWENSLALNPRNANQYRIIASVMVENRLLDRAIEVYRRGRQGCGDPLLFSFEISQLLAISMDYYGSTTEMVQWLRANPGQLSMVEARLSLFTGKPDARAAAVEAVRAGLREGEDIRMYELLGWLYLEGKDYDHGFEVYRKIDRLTQARGVTILGFADRVYRERAFSVAAEAYQEAIHTPLPPSKMPTARYGYAVTLAELATVLDTLTQPLGSLQRKESESNVRFRDALMAFRRIIEDYPATEWSARSYYRIGTIQFERFFDLDQARVSFQRVEEEAGSLRAIHYDVALRIGQIYVAEGDTGHAAQRYRIVADAKDATPDQSDEATFRLAELDFFGGRIGEAQEHLAGLVVNLRADYANDALQLQAFLQDNGSSAPAALAQYGRAEFLTRQKKNTEAIALLEDLVTRMPQALLVDDALFRIALLQEDAGLYREAVSAYTTLLTKFRENSIFLDRAQFSVGEIYDFGLHDRDAAVAAYEKLLTEYPQSIWVAAARKRIRLLRGDAL